MRNKLFHFLEDMSPKARIAFLSAMVVAIINFVGALYWLYIGISTGTAQFYILATIVFAQTMMGGFGVLLSKRGRPTAGILLVLSTGLLYPYTATLVSGFGLMTGLGFMVAGPIMAFPVLPRRSAWGMTIVTTVLSLATILLDVYGSEARPSLPGIFIQLLAVSAVGLLGYFIVRQTWKTNIATSLRLQITISTGAILTILAIIIVSYSIFTARQTAIAAAQSEALAISEVQAGNIKSQIDPALDAARTMAHTLGVVKDSENPIELTRDQANGILRKVEQENPTFLGTWTIWEPNAFDGRDGEYANTPLHDATGRFIPYWVRTGDVIDGVAVIDYETPGIGDFYLIPRATQKETILTPYFYPIDGVDVLMTTLAVPIVENNKFYGVTGVDLPIGFVQSLVDEINLYNGTATAVLFTDTGSLIAVGNQPDLGLQPATSLYEDFEHLQPRIDTGEIFVSLSPDGQYLRAFAPINVGEAGSQWSFGLIIPFSEIIAPATASATRVAAISVGVIILSLLALWFFTGQLVRPILDLTTVANAVSGGDLNAVANVGASNEIGILASTFNSMTSQLRETLTTLEQRVVDRTKALAASAEVSRRLSTILDQKQLIIEVVNQIKLAFNYYHVHIYLKNETSNDLIMVGGTGEVGQTLLARGHKISEGKGLVGRAAQSNSLVLVSDTAQNPNWLPNALLPDTKSEAAVPISIGSEVLGVLDVQQDTVNGLQKEDTDLLQAIAYQVAVALKNAQTYSQTQQIAESESLINEISRKIQNTVTVEQALQVTARELGTALRARDSRVVLSVSDLTRNKNS